MSTTTGSGATAVEAQSLGKERDISFPPVISRGQKEKWLQHLGSPRRQAERLDARIAEKEAKDTEFAFPEISTRRALRFALQNVHRHLLGPNGSKNQRKCTRVRIRTDVELRQRYDPETGALHNPHLFGLVRCGCWHSCTVCNGTISTRKGEEVAEAVKGWTAQGGDVLLGTFTLPHDVGDALAPMHKTVRESFSFVKSGNPWLRQCARYGIAWTTKKGKATHAIPTIAATDTTHGPAGWHNHLHVLFFVARKLRAAEQQALEEWLYERWAKRIEKQGYRRPEPGIGVKLTGGKNAAYYVAKIGLGRELAGMWTKEGREGHRTPFQILRDVGQEMAERDRLGVVVKLKSVALWREWNEAMHGMAQLHWSPGLRTLVKLPELELDDKTLAESENEKHEHELPLATIPNGLWDRTVDVPGFVPSLIEAAATAGIEGIDRIVWLALQRAPATARPDYAELQDEEDKLQNRMASDATCRELVEAHRPEWGETGRFPSWYSRLLWGFTPHRPLSQNDVLDEYYALLRAEEKRGGKKSMRRRIMGDGELIQHRPLPPQLVGALAHCASKTEYETITAVWADVLNDHGV